MITVILKEWLDDNGNFVFKFKKVQLCDLDKWVNLKVVNILVLVLDHTKASLVEILKVNLILAYSKKEFQ